MNKFLGSSADPEELSLTIKSAMVWLVPALVALSTYSGIDITQNELIDLANNLTILVATAMTVFGLGRKIYIQIYLRFFNK